jgi:hypothetical protein
MHMPVRFRLPEQCRPQATFQAEIDRNRQVLFLTSPAPYKNTGAWLPALTSLPLTHLLVYDHRGICREMFQRHEMLDTGLYQNNVLVLEGY